MRSVAWLYAAALLWQCAASGDTSHQNQGTIQFSDPTIQGTTIKWESWDPVDVKITTGGQVVDGEANPVLKPEGKNRPVDNRKHSDGSGGGSDGLGNLLFDESAKKGDEGPSKEVQSGARVSPGDGQQGLDGLLNSMVGPDQNVRSLSVKGPDGSSTPLSTTKANGQPLTQSDLQSIATGAPPSPIKMQDGTVLGKPQKAQGG